MDAGGKKLVAAADKGVRAAHPWAAGGREISRKTVKNRPVTGYKGYAVVYDSIYIRLLCDFSQMEPNREAVLNCIGENVRRLRTKKKLSLRELSYLCNIDNSKISKIEAGRFNITVATLLELANALDVTPAELLKTQKVSR